MKYRSRIEIIADMLSAANKGASKGRIVYAAYLSYTKSHEYLDMLNERGLVIYNEGSELYQLTEKGMHLLRICEQLKEMTNYSEPALERDALLITE